MTRQQFCNKFNERLIKYSSNVRLREGDIPGTVEVRMEDPFIYSSPVPAHPTKIFEQLLKFHLEEAGLGDSIEFNNAGSIFWLAAGKFED